MKFLLHQVKRKPKFFVNLLMNKIRRKKENVTTITTEKQKNIRGSPIMCKQTKNIKLNRKKEKCSRERERSKGKPLGHFGLICERWASFALWSVRFMLRFFCIFKFSSVYFIKRSSSTHSSQQLNFKYRDRRIKPNLHRFIIEHLLSACQLADVGF